MSAISDTAGQTTFTFLFESTDSVHTVRQIAGATSMTVRKQESSSPCTWEDSFGFDKDRIWVDKGCRAVFDVTITQS